jgi:hypothetical protein
LLSEHILTIIVKDTTGEYELIILRPSHFLIDDFPMVIKHPTTQDFTCFYASASKDGFLRERGPTGPPLSPFRSRGDREIPLNPILVNFAAVVRLRRLIFENPAWGSELDPHVILVLERVMALHAAVLWDPEESHKEHFLFKAPQESYHHASTTATQPSSSPFGAILGINTGTPTTILERYMDLIEAGSFPSRLLDCTTF